jgi:hypothetical protein
MFKKVWREKYEWYCTKYEKLLDWNWNKCQHFDICHFYNWNLKFSKALMGILLNYLNKGFKFNFWFLQQ